VTKRKNMFRAMENGKWKMENGEKRFGTRD
jgi:hypothetical protein